MQLQQRKESPSFVRSFVATPRAAKADDLEKYKVLYHLFFVRVERRSCCRKNKRGSFFLPFSCVKRQEPKTPFFLSFVSQSLFSAAPADEVQELN